MSSEWKNKLSFAAYVFQYHGFVLSTVAHDHCKASAAPLVLQELQHK
jgi:hypothetical protein